MLTLIAVFCATEVLTKENIVEPMREIRRALLEADVSGLLDFDFYVYGKVVYLHFPAVLIGEPSCCKKVCASCQ